MTMRTLNRLLVGTALVLAVATPSFAGMAVIEITAPLTEHSNEGVKAAVKSAVENAVKGATAMGLSRFAVKNVHVLPRMVVVQVLATDSESDPVLEPKPGGPEPGSSEPGTESLVPSQRQVWKPRGDAR